MLTKGKSGAWPGVNGDKRAAEQITTMMHQAHGQVLIGRKGEAWQSTTMMHQEVGWVAGWKGTG